MLDIVYYPDDALRTTADPVDSINGEIAELADHMIETMQEAKGIGLAGPQVDRQSRLFVVQVPGEDPRVFINPTILETSMELGFYEEGCLSIPGIYADVKRPVAVKIQAYNGRGRRFNLEADGLLARVIQHELDHLNGVLFFDHLSDRKRDRIMRAYRKPAL
jgi:peptide deformylase